MINVHKIIHGSKIYGPLDRDVIWFKGCSLHCKDCINPELWSFAPDRLYSIDELLNIIHSKELTLLGGEPLDQEDILALIKRCKEENIGIVLFTGYEEPELNGNKKEAALLCDVVIYGRYDSNKKDDSLYLRGSSNQRIVFNTKRYNEKDFEKPNSYELIINNDIELHGRNKNLLDDLLK